MGVWRGWRQVGGTEAGGGMEAGGGDGGRWKGGKQVERMVRKAGRGGNKASWSQSLPSVFCIPPKPELLPRVGSMRGQVPRSRSRQWGPASAKRAGFLFTVEEALLREVRKHVHWGLQESRSPAFHWTSCPSEIWGKERGLTPSPSCVQGLERPG